MKNKYEAVFNDYQIKLLDNLVKKYQGYESEEIFERLWKITHGPLPAYIDEDLGIMNFETSCNIHVREYILSKLGREDIVKIKRTILNDSLFRAFNNDKFAVYRVEDVVKSVFANNDEKELQKIWWKLNSIDDSSVFDGLITLGFNDKEAVYLFMFADVIFKYFNKRYEIYEMNKYKKDKDILIEIISKLYENKDLILKIIEESKKISSLYDDPDVQRYSILKIFKVSEALESAQKIMNYSEKLKEIGINSDWIMDKSDILLNVLSKDFLLSYDY